MNSDGVCRGVLRLGMEEEKKAEARRRHPAPIWEGASEAAGGGGREIEPTRGGSGARAGGSLPTGWRRPTDSGP
jgi:hypothetical protein